MIYKGRQYAKIFFKNEKDSGRCNMCAFDRGGCEIFLVQNTECFTKIDDESGKEPEFWSWFEVGGAK